jgi:4-amino-4-deoxy-L-arabinose transferase-like glycosyltransferase
MILQKLYQKLIVPYWQILVIFFTGLLLRLAYNAFSLDKRICHFGDAYYYLSAGLGLLKLVSQSHSLSEAIATLAAQYTPSPSLMQSVLSTALTDRLLMDGPIFPAYLALVEFLSGINVNDPAFGTHCFQLSIFSSVLDAFTCLVIYFAGLFAFNRRVAFLAGLLYALYPPAIINTQHFYTEPLANFLLYLWLTFVFYLSFQANKKKGFGQSLVWFLMGLAAALVMLVKPIFALIPPVVAVLLYIGRVGIGQGKLNYKLSKRMIISLATGLAGIALIFIPWLALTQAITGKATMFVSRAPSYNIYAGNQVETDGWRVWPAANIPGTTDAAIATVKQSALKQPLAFLALEIRKIARLWGGVWNEDQFAPLGININIQDFIHQMLLFLGFLGICLIVAGRKKDSQAFTAGICLVPIILLHFVYCAFEPISRYTMTAMPAIILLASFASVHFWQPGKKRRFIGALIFVSFLIWLAHNKGFSVDLIASLMPPSLVPWIMGLVLNCLLCTALALMTLKLILSENGVQRQRLLKCLVACTCVLLAAISACYFFADNTWREWSAPIVQGQVIRQDIVVPKLAQGLAQEKVAGKFVYVLVDLDPKYALPPFSLSVNGQAVQYPALPWAQVNTTSPDALQLLSIQGQAMGRDLKLFRQWWAFPIDAKYIKFGEANKIEITSESDDVLSPPRIYGDYPSGGKRTMLPSLNTFSWTKGFATFERGDARIYEPIDLAGEANAFGLSSNSWNKNDLSDDWGRQYGAYRIRLAVPLAKSNAGDDQLKQAESNLLTDTIEIVPAKVLVTEDAPRGILGSDPNSMLLTEIPLALPTDLPSGTIFLFQSELKALGAPATAYVSVDFHGTENGKPVHWNSVWQPAVIATATDWRPASFADAIPDNILHLKDLNVTIMVSPFDPDYLFTKRKQALKRTGAIRNATFSLLRPLDLLPAKDIVWKIF